MVAVTRPYTRESYKLLHNGAIAFAEIERAGIRIDTAYLDKTIDRTWRRVKRMRRKLAKTEVMKTWKKKYGARTNLNSGTQLGDVLFDVVKQSALVRAISEKYSGNDYAKWRRVCASLELSTH